MNKLRRLFKMFLNKKSVNNGMWMYLLQIFNTVVPLITLPYITRILGSSKYGVFSIAINIIGYMQVVVEYGFGMSATRKVALSDKNYDETNRTFTSVLFSRMILALACIVVAIIYILLNKNDKTLHFCLIVLLISLLGYCVQQNWLFQGMQEMKYISIVNIVSRTISVILIFTWVKSQDDLVLYCMLYAISPFLSGFLSFILAKIKYKVRIIKIQKKDIILELKSGWYVFTTQLSSKVFGAIGITFLGVFAESSEVGIYSAIQKIPNVIMLAWMPISQVMYPISSKKMQESFKEGEKFLRKVKLFILPLFIVGVGIIIVSSKLVVSIAFGEEYAEYYYWIIPQLIWLIVSINNNFWGIQTLLGSGHDKEYSKCFQWSVLCTIVFNLIFIYFGGGTGASIAPLLSECVLSVALYRDVKKLRTTNDG